MDQTKSKKVDGNCTSITSAVGFEKKLDKLKICTYNVHMWTDATDEPNIFRVVNLISELEPDLLCLQVYEIFALIGQSFA